MKTTAPSPAELYSAQMETYGLDESDGAQLKLSRIDDIHTIHELKFTVADIVDHTPAIKIPYFHPLTGELLSAAPKWPSFYRIRLLGELKWKTSFKPHKKPPPKYLNPPDIGLCAYYPTNLRIGWASVFNDISQPVTITEGEFKAARACKAGFPTIGLGGVSNVRSNELGQQGSMLTELVSFNWVKRRINICFDSDYRTNPNVGAALQRLADLLHAEGAICYLVEIPEGPNQEKRGLDDFINSVGANGGEAFKELCEVASPLGMSRHLFGLNDRYTHAINPSGIFDRKLYFMLPIDLFQKSFSEEVHINRTYTAKTQKVEYLKVALGSAWLKWGLHTKVDKLVYLPTNEDAVRTTYELDGVTYLNTWSGFPLTPIKGDPKPFLDHIDLLFTEAPKEAKTWFLRWLAYPLQHPGAKMLSSVVIAGRIHGTGKSTLGYIMEAIYGRNFSEVKQDALHENFNEWAVDKQFVMCDDITGWSKRQDADRFKNMITQKKITIKRKYISDYTVDACISYLWTTNQLDAFRLDDTDRRFFVQTIKSGRQPKSYFTKLHNWLDHKNGYAIVFDYLLNLDLGDFSPFDPAMETESKDDMRDLSRSDLETWVRNMIDVPDSYLKIGDLVFNQELIPIETLVNCFDPERKTKTDNRMMGGAMSDAGALSTVQVRWKNGKSRAYVIRNHKKWETLKNDTDAVKTYLNKHLP